MRHLWQKSSEQNQLNKCEYLELLTQGTQKPSKEESQQVPCSHSKTDAVYKARPITRTTSHWFSSEQDAQDLLLEGGGERKGLTHAEKENRTWFLANAEMPQYYYNISPIFTWLFPLSDTHLEISWGKSHSSSYLPKSFANWTWG